MTAAARQPTSLKETGRQTFPLLHGEPRLLALGDHGLAYNTDGPNDDSSVYWASYATGQTQVVAAHTWQVLQLEVSTDWLVWLEQDLTQSDAIEPVLWRIRAKNFESGAVRTLLQAKVRTVLAPGIMLWHHTLFYMPYRGMARGTADVRALDLSNGEDRLIVRDVAVGDIDYDGHDLIGSVTWDRGHGPGEGKTDMFVINRRPRLRITNSGRVANNTQLDGSTMLYEECAEAQCKVLTRQWPEGAPRSILAAESPSPSLGTGFFTILETGVDGSVITAVPLGDPAHRLTMADEPGERPTTEARALGQRVAWYTSRGADLDRPGHLVVATIEPG